jgi:hypothetical protein
MVVEPRCQDRLGDRQVCRPDLGLDHAADPAADGEALARRLAAPVAIEEPGHAEGRIDEPDTEIDQR